MFDLLSPIFRALAPCSSDKQYKQTTNNVLHSSFQAWSRYPVYYQWLAQLSVCSWHLLGGFRILILNWLQYWIENNLVSNYAIWTFLWPSHLDYDKHLCCSPQMQSKMKKVSNKWFEIIFLKEHKVNKSNKDTLEKPYQISPLTLFI